MRSNRAGHSPQSGELRPRRITPLAVLLLMASAAWAQQTQQNPPAQQAPLPAAETEEPENIENMLSVGVFYWKTSIGRPGIRSGQLTTTPGQQTMDFPRNGRGIGMEVTIPTGGFNRLEISGFQLTDSGAYRPNQDLIIEGTSVAKNDLVVQSYDIKNIRFSWNYLTFPVPPLGSKFRVKTYWEVQHTRVKPTFKLPSTDNPATEIDETAVVNPRKNLTLPGAGIGFEYIPSRSFRIEGRGSGMAWPSKSQYVDLQLVAVARWRGVEFFGGAKAFHFRTGLKAEYYLRGTLGGPFFGIRYVFPKLSPRPRPAPPASGTR